MNLKDSGRLVRITLSAVLAVCMSVCMMPMGHGLAEANAAGSKGDPQAEISLEQNGAFNFKKGKAQKALKKEAESYPEYFDLRNVDTDNDPKTPGESFVTPVKLQNPFGTCWGFAAIAAAESSLLGSGIAQADGYAHVAGDGKKELDLSEKHLAYFANTYIDDPNDPQYREGTHFRNVSEEEKKSSDYKYMTGGFSYMATSLFAAGAGPNLEDRTAPGTAPGDESDETKTLRKYLRYSGIRGERAYWNAATNYDEHGNPLNYKKVPVWFSRDDDWSIPEKYRYYQSYRLKNSFILPDPAGRNDEDDTYEFNPDAINAIKQQLCKNNRAVSINFCAELFLPGQDTSEKKYMSEYWAHFTNVFDNSNHSVTIVGWDDNYPASNFRNSDQLVDKKGNPLNGAFLIKNSWGSELNDFPNNGYRHWGLLEGQDGIPYDKDAAAKSDRATGYFWISYYDRSLNDPEALEFEKVSGDNGSYIEQWDKMNPTYCLSSYKDETRAANVFKTSATSKLTDISVMTTTPDTDVDYKVYLLGDSYDDPEDGILIAQGNEKYYYGGYHKIKIEKDEQRTLAKGQKYSVVIHERENEDNTDYTSCSAVINYDARKEYSVSVINKGESYYYSDDKWSDLSDKETQDQITQYYRSYGNEVVIDNFPIKSYLEPVTYNDGGKEKVFNGYLTINNWQEGNPGTFELVTGNQKTLTAEFRGLSEDMPDDWDPDIRWKSGNEEVMTVTPKSPDEGRADIKGITEGKADLVIDCGDYGTRVISVKVRKPAVSSFDLDLDDYPVYTGKKIEPAVTNVFSEDTDESLKEGKDYTVEYKDNVNAGKAIVTVKGTGKYGGSVSDDFTIDPADIQKAQVSGIIDKTYTGKEMTQSPKVVLDGVTLNEGSDYSLAYKDNKNVGTATVAITGKGNYEESVEKKFKITKAQNPLEVQGKTARIKYKKLKKKNKTVKGNSAMTVKNAKGKVTYKLAGVKKARFKKYFKVNAANGNITVKKKLKKGNYKLTIKVRAAGDANYNASPEKSAAVSIAVK